MPVVKTKDNYLAEVVALAATNPNPTATVIETDGGARITTGS